MNKENFYNIFTREQLIERCEYLQRSCERKEDTITDREMENADLEKEIERLNNIIGKVIGLIYDYQMNDKENVNYKELLYILKGSDKE